MRLELVEVREPRLPFEAELRLDPDPGLGDFPERFVSPLRDTDESNAGGGPGAAGIVGRTGNFPAN